MRNSFRLRQVLRILESMAAALTTWQLLMRSSGPDAPIQLTVSTASTVTHFGSTLVPAPTSRRQWPERLDPRTRLGLLLQGLSPLTFGGLLLHNVLRPQILERRNRRQRILARQPLWNRLTATERHGKAFAFLSAGVALLSGIAAYRTRLNGGFPSLFPATTLSLLGQVFPDLPIYGMARVPRTTPRWYLAVSVFALLPSLLAFGQLRAAFMSDEKYQERQRAWRERQ